MAQESLACARLRLCGKLDIGSRSAEKRPVTVFVGPTEHSKIFEKSRFATEIGAAITATPNGTRVLRKLGFDFQRARGQQIKVMESVHGTSLERISSMDTRDAEDRYGAPVMAFHRVDLHKELRRLALEEDGKGLPAVLHLGSPVVKASPKEGWVELEDGTVHSGGMRPSEAFQSLLDTSETIRARSFSVPRRPL